MGTNDWKVNAKRFVAFFDILGFKEMVLKSSHNKILEKLNTLKDLTQHLEKVDWDGNHKPSVEKKTKSVTFSDSIIFFSKGDTIEDLYKILLDSWVLFRSATENKIAIKGAISFGEITVDFKKSLFFGQPIIDAFLLHEELNMLGAVLDHNAENQWKALPTNDTLEKVLITGKTKMKFGIATHTIVTPLVRDSVIKIISNLEKLNQTTSGKPRLYIDNSIEYFESIKDLKPIERSNKNA